MKRSILIVLSIACLVSLFCALGAVGHAETAEYESTKAFLKFLDENDIKYSYYGINGSHEEIDVTYELDNYDSVMCEIYFKDDNEEASLRIWNLANVTAGKSFTLSTLNELNDSYKFAKFVLDESDNTVQAELDMYIDGKTCGRPVYDAMMALFDIIDEDEVFTALQKLE